MKNKNLLYGVVTLVAAYLFGTFLAPGYFYLRGKSAYEHQNYVKSAAFLSRALMLRPHNKDFRYYYVKSLSELKPVYSVQKKMYKMANSNQDDTAKMLANEKLAEWKRNINLNVGSNYIDQAPSDANIIRWNKDSFPLKTYIDEKNLANLPDYYKESILRALNQWENSVDFISFEIVPKKSHAQIIIEFKNLPEDVCDGGMCKYVVGYTRPKISGRKLKNMTVTVYKANPKGEYLSDKELYNTVLHELGHALGIMGHSYSTDDLMYLQTHDKDNFFVQYRGDFHYLSGSDVNTMHLLYMLDPTITDKRQDDKSGLIYTPIILGSPEEIAHKKVEEALNYINTSPELSVGYINLAGAYADLKEYNKAISALENALDTAKNDDEKFIIYYNYAYIYMNLKEYDTALEYANLAKNIQTSQDVLELIGIIEHDKRVSK